MQCGGGDGGGGGGGGGDAADGCRRVAAAGAVLPGPSPLLPPPPPCQGQTFAPSCPPETFPSYSTHSRAGPLPSPSPSNRRRRPHPRPNHTGSCCPGPRRYRTIHIHPRTSPAGCCCGVGRQSVPTRKETKMLRRVRARGAWCRLRPRDRTLQRCPPSRACFAVVASPCGGDRLVGGAGGAGTRTSEREVALVGTSAEWTRWTSSDCLRWPYLHVYLCLLVLAGQSHSKGAGTRTRRAFLPPSSSSCRCLVGV